MAFLKNFSGKMGFFRRSEAESWTTRKRGKDGGGLLTAARGRNGITNICY